MNNYHYTAEYLAEDVQRLAEAMIQSKKNGTPFCVLTGAGCSVTAGIPAAAALVRTINEAYPRHCAKLSAAERADYGTCMSVLPPADRQELLQQYLDPPRVNWAHLAIAGLMKAGFVARVMTFNFDYTLMRACGIYSLYPKVYDFGSAHTKNDDLLVPPAIVHLHGLGHGLALKNTAAETRAHAESMTEVWRRTLSKYPLLVVGYSGESDGVFPVITAEFNGARRVYWLGHGAQPSERVAAFLSKGGETTEFWGGADADRTLVEIAQEVAQQMGLEATDDAAIAPLHLRLLTDPYAHMLAEIEPIQDFPVGSSHYDVLRNFKAKLKQRQGTWAPETASQPDALGLIFQGKWDEIKEPADASDQEQAELYQLARYKQGDDLNNEGLALLRKAESQHDQTKIEAAAHGAIGKYEAAVEMAPDDPEIFFNWGNALLTLARVQADDNRPENVIPLLEAAIAKYEKSNAIKPGEHTVLGNWGNTLLMLAQIKLDDQLHDNALPLLEAAIAKYEKSNAQERGDYEMLGKWGKALLALAGLKQAERLYQQALDKFRAVLRVEPNELQTLHFCGVALLELAAMKQDDTSLLKEAEAVLAIAAVIEPDLVYDLARVKAKLGKLKASRALLTRCQTAATLPPASYMKADPYFAAVRAESWFQNLLQSAAS